MNPPEPQSIVVLTREHIGDLICTTPAIRALRVRFPQAHIAVEVGERAACVLQNNPHIDEIIIRPDHQGLRGKARFIRLLRQRKFDLAVILDDSADMILYTWLGGTPRRAGLVHKKKFANLLTESVPFDRQAHEMVDNFRNVAALLGADISDAATEVFPSDSDRAAIADRWRTEEIAPNDLVIGLNPGASAPSNRWLPERFAELGDLLLARPNYRVIIFGGPTDRESSAEIQRHMTRQPIVWTGELTLLELAEALRRCDVVVTGDTGPMHLAVATKTPVIALFGPAEPHESGPGYAPGHTVIRNVVGCPQCTKYLCRANRECMRKITALEAADAVDAALRVRRPEFALTQTR